MHGDGASEAALVDIVNNLPSETVILLSVFDTAEKYCRQPCEDMLSSIGSTLGGPGYRGKVRVQVKTHILYMTTNKLAIQSRSEVVMLVVKL